MVYKSQSNIELALEKFSTAAGYLEKIIPKQRSQSTLSIVYYNMGYCYIDLGKNLNAERSFTKSLFQAEGFKAKSLQAFAMKGLAEKYQREKKYIQSTELLLKAEKLSEGIGDLLLTEEIYKLLADNYLISNMFDQYILYNNKYRKTHFLKEQNEFKSINRSIDTQERENEKRLAIMKLKYRKLDFLIVVISLFIVTVLICYIVKRKKLNSCLEKTNSGTLLKSL